ncbi:MAG: YggT family protein, partial [Pusillimonas sp.]|nr:YggT family protein [Pusillimonas sp.]
MFGNILHFIINILFTLFGVALLIRAWMFAIRLHPLNPYSQALLRITDWLVVPLKKFIPSTGRLDWPSIAAAWVVALIYL